MKINSHKQRIEIMLKETKAIIAYWKNLQEKSTKDAPYNKFIELQEIKQNMLEGLLDDSLWKNVHPSKV